MVRSMIRKCQYDRYGGWRDNLCASTYVTTLTLFPECALSCKNGELNDQTCQCECPGGWSGNLCGGMYKLWDMHCIKLKRNCSLPKPASPSADSTRMSGRESDSVSIPNWRFITPLSCPSWCTPARHGQFTAGVLKSWTGSTWIACAGYST